GQHGDLWILYMGNNEVVGPFGAGTAFGKKSLSRHLIGPSLALKATRTGQCLDSLLSRFNPTPASKKEWGGMGMFLENQVRHDDPRMAGVYDSFQQNLDDILRTGRRSGAKIVLSTVASNRKNCAPMASLHRPGFAGADLERWDSLFQ